MTGDRVVLRPTDGAEPRVEFYPRRGGSGAFSVQRSAEGTYVTPTEAAVLVPKVLDRELFNVTALVEMGYDDANAKSLPLIVEHAGRDALPTSEDSHLRVTDELPSIDAAAATLPKDETEELGADLAELDNTGGSAVTQALGGATKIWLDRAVTATSISSSAAPAADQPWDPYLPQVGAPAAWDQGLTGAGVTVAVLDTGVDDEHPALAGQVQAAQNFSDSDTDDDLVGHGTHVASLVAGTGAGSDGARQGISPAAALLSGKVLGDTGSGQTSWVISGMEWAAEQGADVVNLSLGSRNMGGADPLVESLEQLTETTDTLFVVAGGNRGWIGRDPFSIDTPGIAPSALTVAAVGPEDGQAIFSSEGPTLGGFGLKPDVSAPGVDLLGARAGAREGDPDLYRPESGTSMSTPLVAGAAALLIEQHPAWTAGRVKAALMNAAHPAQPTDEWVTGSGRLDLAAATGDLRSDTGSVDLGVLQHPEESPQTRQVVVTNDADQPVTLAAQDSMKDFEGNPAPAGAVTVEPESLTVEAGDEATVQVTVDPAELVDSPWRGLITFSEGGQERLRIPVGLYDEPEAYDLHISVIDRNGNPWDPSTGAGHPNADPTLHSFDRATGDFHRLAPDANGEAAIRVSPGRYSLFGRGSPPGRLRASRP